MSLVKFAPACRNESKKTNESKKFTLALSSDFRGAKKIGRT